MKQKISKRLEMVAQFVPQDARLVDVGSDHAYLPLFLVERGVISYAIAGEVVQGPYQSALQNVQNSDHKDCIEVRLANGLAAFEEVDQMTTITIAGMGGRLIADILEAGKDKLNQIERLILQPNNREDDVRVWLEKHGFKLVAENMIEEHGKFYEILVAEPGSQTLTAMERRFGPYLLQKVSPVFQKKWELEIDKLQHALDQIPTEHEVERNHIEEKIQHIKEVLDVSK
ncbi:MULTISPECIES: tRNA (adenine(22)-N(1))-methyltransferase TrmK [unclassified Streptococcus]|uniref:tRNA (adenine(22)-N(1))-methyltransferase n=1 Tax=unclassified Streptococcus TaxID=2608887 RepID=UPI001072EBD1|nr:MULTISPECIES: tRNA (adenine(22)-N(1))-methyltransferase TrmK [unclassified Streptococcus]MBF0786577.1 tRNA (adenine-N(1))-methyltransferase [Streptococcus sp. 19428wC2_LYSM12]MCQ9210930.1 tRNA (adenine(22)-N(1))-methyltransferase TrmK [Streptococcus sp. B01]MCQ9214199.1 tRNA (adenine(22)-N(1))-methyltransferase TrmK [Streptococcus sp. O1]TFV06540.1 tRNA (adenine-N(1))-methyltransferase [Streptococcus sp. LYSM12]